MKNKNPKSSVISSGLSLLKQVQEKKARFENIAQTKFT